MTLLWDEVPVEEREPAQPAWAERFEVEDEKRCVAAVNNRLVGGPDVYLTWHRCKRPRVRGSEFCATHKY